MIQANDFLLSSKNSEIHFTIGMQGEFLLALNNRALAELSVTGTPLSDVVSATITSSVDGDTERLSLLVLPVNIIDRTSADVQTVEIFSTHKGSIAGPSAIVCRGTTYKVEMVSGTASSVQTLG